MDDSSRAEIQAELWEATESLHHAFLRHDDEWVARLVQHINELRARLAWVPTLGVSVAAAEPEAWINGRRAPEIDEVEFSTFGPGYGEGHVLHLGHDEWMLVDSCVRSGRVPALEYLKSMGVDPARSVRLVVATQWHDDHIRGMSQIVRSCPEATFVSSLAFRNERLLTAIGRQSQRAFGPVTSGVDEMWNTLDYLASSGEQHRVQWAIQNSTIYRRTRDTPCTIQVLAPGDMAVERAGTEIIERVEHSTIGRVPRPARQLGALVIWVEVADISLLLGSDLQETSDPATGWTSVVACRTGHGRRSEVFKVPHHGSSNAHQPLVWRDLLVQRPEAVVRGSAADGLM